MKASILLADSACEHGDGTFSVLRGGITELYPQPDGAISFVGSVIIRIRATGEEDTLAPHAYALRLREDATKENVYTETGSFRLPRIDAAVSTVRNVMLTFKKTGRFTFTLSVDDWDLDTWPLSVHGKRPKGDKP